MMEDDILLVDDDPGSIALMGRILADVGSVRFAINGVDALRLAREFTPSLVLLDTEMPGMGGIETCRMIKADPTLADVPVIFVTSHSETSFEVSGFEVGAADFIAKPVSAPLLRARVKTQLRVKRMSDELRRIATVDVLTGLANRRRLDEALEQEWRRSIRSLEPLALLMIDVDHFELITDRGGQAAGDACLRAVAQALSGTTLRLTDLVARYGADEFAVLLPETPRIGAEHVAHRVLESVAALAIPHETSPTAPHVTVSVGIGYFDEHSTGWWLSPGGQRSLEYPGVHPSSVDLVRAADRALHSAKEAGRARARQLDVAQVEAPHLARDITAPSLGRGPATGSIPEPMMGASPSARPREPPG